MVYNSGVQPCRHICGDGKNVVGHHWFITYRIERTKLYDEKVWSLLVKSSGSQRYCSWRPTKKKKVKFRDPLSALQFK
jgi:hypothetical protein